MGKIYNTAVINAPMDQVWKTIRNFHDLSWASAIVTKLAAVGGQKGDQIGAKRVINDAFHETLLSLDDCKHKLCYSIDEAPGPMANGSVSNYVGTWRVLPITENNTTLVEFQSSFDSPDAAAIREFLNPIYQALLGALKQRFS